MFTSRYKISGWGTILESKNLTQLERFSEIMIKICLINIECKVGLGIHELWNEVRNRYKHGDLLGFSLHIYT